MASYLYITEYASIGYAQVGGAIAQVPQEPPLAQQVVSVTSTSAQSAAFNAQTTLVRLHIDGVAPIGFLFGTNPTAQLESGSPPSARLAGNQTEYHAVPKGQSYMVAAILATQ